ncbi:uncharacterized protein EHS24_008139 [Apiotrichum porosum]|uniref:Uncharacterized protein n=1 Tax=Apiotrichum porosum TaxID=105984 RepID=A0A427XSN7_9TREE|nr:uncharacterized protein EHS24_008139 [Apiotrichum porosum]RSH81942.1 hypothetical protein EHS24_008139 [Apiotrichum porosum]
MPHLSRKHAPPTPPAGFVTQSASSAADSPPPSPVSLAAPVASPSVVSVSWTGDPRRKHPRAEDEDGLFEADLTHHYRRAGRGAMHRKLMTVGKRRMLLNKAASALAALRSGIGNFDGASRLALADDMESMEIEIELSHKAADHDVKKLLKPKEVPFAHPVHC